MTLENDLPMTYHLFAYPDTPSMSEPIGGVFATTTALDRLPDTAHTQIAARAAQCAPDDVLVFWDTRLGSVPLDLLEQFARSGHDVWHPGILSNHDVDFLDYIYPLDMYVSDIPRDVVGAVNFRLTMRAAFVRARIVQILGAFDSGFTSIQGAALEMGWRWHRRGAVLRQQPALLTQLVQETTATPIADRYRLLALHSNANWRALIAAARILGGASPGEWRLARTASRHTTLAKIPTAAAELNLEAVTLPAAPRVSVVLPTYGRYKYLIEVLGDIRAQTIRPIEIIIADGNFEHTVDPQVYVPFSDLPLKVIYLQPEQRGTCGSRNACMQAASGDYIWFVDDDSRFDARNLENHLRLLEAYDADVSVGPAYTRTRPDLHGYQAEVSSSFMDCGTTVCRTAIVEKAGGFDMQYNNSLPQEDGDIGDRFLIAGGVMLNNPHARRFHYLAPVGGARSSPNNVHRWRRWSGMPRPTQAVYYHTGRYHSEKLAWRATLISWLVIGWRRKEGQKTTPRWLIGNAIAEVLALPVSLYRLAHSVRIARAMLRQGARIPAIRRADATPSPIPPPLETR